MPPPSVAERIAQRSDALTPAERLVAEALLADPQAVAFGTVAALAARAATSGPTVLRLAAKLGFTGFVELQAAVQEELASRLRPAAERIRQRPAPDPIARALEVEIDNVSTTLGAVDRGAFAAAVTRLARAGRVGVLSGEATAGVGLLLADALAMTRDGVEIVSGSPVRVSRSLALHGPADVVVAIDLRRYERWVLEAARAAVQASVPVVAVTDGVLSPLAGLASEVFVVTALGAGPFDSHVGTLALANALAAGVAARLRRSAASRLDRVESAWRSAGALTEE